MRNQNLTLHMTWWRGIWETLIGFRDLLLQPPEEEIHSMIITIMIMILLPYHLQNSYD